MRCGSKGLVTQSRPWLRPFLPATMSSGATSLSRKRTHSSEQVGERSGPDLNTKKPRTSSEAPSNRPARKKRARKKRTVPVVEDIAGSSSTGSHGDGAEPMSPRVQHRGVSRGKPRRVVESDEEDANIVPGPTPRLLVAQKVCRSGACDAPRRSCFAVTNESRPPFIFSIPQGQREGSRTRTRRGSSEQRRPFEENRRLEREARCSGGKVGYPLHLGLFFQGLPYLPNMR